MVVNEDTRTVVGEFDSWGAADAWIAETHDHQENVGLPVRHYAIYPVRATVDGKDVR